MTKPDSLPEDAARFIIFASAFLLLWFLSLYIIFWPTGFGEREEQYIYVLFFMSVPFCAAIGIWWKTFSPASSDRWPYGKSATAILSIALPTAILAWGFTGINIALYHSEYEVPSISIKRFVSGMGVTLAACLPIVLICKRTA